MLNVDRLREELVKITLNPERWNQGDWIQGVKGPADSPPEPCGTFGCLAGNTVLAENVPLQWEFNELGLDVNGKPHGYWYVERTESGDSIRNTAQSILGLTHWQASELFAGSNGLDDLWRVASKISAGEISDRDYRTAMRKAAEKRFEQAQQKLKEFDNTHPTLRAIIHGDEAREAERLEQDLEKAALELTKVPSEIPTSSVW